MLSGGKINTYLDDT